MKIKLFIKKSLLFAVLLFAIQNNCLASKHSLICNPDKEKSHLLASKKKEHEQSKKRISITIDDLPFVGEFRNFHLNRMIETLIQHQVPATGFIIASEVRPNNWELLHKFRDAGLGLGNHTLSHANLNKMTTKEYIEEIKQADHILLPVLTEPKYFRYPYLAMSSGQKKVDILCYLAKKNYQVAPITIDSKDFVFNQRLLSVPEINRRAYLEELKPFYLDFIWQQTIHAEHQINHNPHQAQILLIHANLLNAYVLPDIINLYRQNGYEIVKLEDALKTFKSPLQCIKPRIRTETQLSTQKKIKNDKDIEHFIEWD